MTRERNHTLDIIKLFAAMNIMLIHIPISMPALIGSIYYSLFDFAVPTFAIATGYLICEKFSNWNKIKKNVKTFFFLFLGWKFFYIIWTVLLRSNVYKIPLSSSFQWLILDSKYLLLGGQGFGIHLWYLLAMAQGITILYFLHKKFSWKQLTVFYFLLIIIFNIIGVVLINPINNSALSTTYMRNGLIEIPFFILLGINLRHNKTNSERINLPLLIALLLIPVQIVEKLIYINVSQNSFLFGEISLCSIAIAYFLIKWSVQNPNINFFPKLNPKFSEFFFFIHIAIIDIIKLISMMAFGKISIVVAPITVIVSILMFFVWEKIKKLGVEK